MITISGQTEVAGPPVVPAMFDAADDTGAGSVADWRGGALDTLAERNTGDAATTYEVQDDDGVVSTRSYAEGDILASIENVTGSRDDDEITGDGVPNVLKGGGGNDKLNGGGQDDKLYGGEGNDMLGQCRCGR